MMLSYKKSLYSVFFVYFLDGFVFAIVFPILAPLLLNSEYGFCTHACSKETQHILLGLILTAFPIGNFIGAPIVGDLADTYGRKRVFYFTILGTTLGLLLSGWAIAFNSYLFLFIGRFVTGVFAGNASLCYAVIADISTTEKLRSNNYGYLIALGGVSWILAIVIASYTAQAGNQITFNPALPFYISAALMSLSLFCVYRFFEETYVVKERKKLSLLKGVREIKLAFKERGHMRLFILSLFWYTAWMLSLQWVTPYFMETFDPTNEKLSFFLLYLGICWLLGSSLVNHYLIKYFTSLTLLCYAMLGAFLFFAIVPFHAPLWFFYLCYGMLCLFAAVAWANISNVISMSALRKDQGKIMGINQAMTALGEMIGPFLGGFIIILSNSAIFFTCATLTLIACLMLFMERKKFVSKS